MLLEIKDISVEFVLDNAAVVEAVSGVSLEVDRGQVLGLVGESGCGKSVTAMSVPRLLPMPPGRITQGRILFDGIDLLQLSLEELRAIRGARIGVIFQDPMSALSPLHRILEQLTEGLHLHQDISAPAARELALNWLERVGIPEPTVRAAAYPHELSGGMQQRVMIAMALIMEPDLIIADEPTTALDVTTQAQILSLMQVLLDKKSALFLITHDMGVVARMATHIAVMYAGQVVEQGVATDFFHDPRHPYSAALMAAMPSMQTRGTRLKAIPGQVPGIGEYPAGCRFHDRCPVARESCASEPPEMIKHGKRAVRCPWAVVD